MIIIFNDEFGIFKMFNSSQPHLKMNSNLIFHYLMLVNTFAYNCFLPTNKTMQIVFPIIFTTYTIYGFIYFISFVDYIFTFSYCSYYFFASQIFYNTW